MWAVQNQLFLICFVDSAALNSQFSLALKLQFTSSQNDEASLMSQQYSLGLRYDTEHALSNFVLRVIGRPSLVMLGHAV